MRKIISNELLGSHALLDFSNFQDILTPVLSELPEFPRVIVLFDEIEPLLAYDWAMGFLGQWRKLLNNSALSLYFTAVFSGAHEMSTLRRDVGSPLGNILEWRNLHLLTFTDACRLMQEPISREMPAELLELVYTQTGGHPMLLQYIMQQVAANLTMSSNEVAKQAIEKFNNQHRLQFSDWWSRYCPPIAQRIYTRLPDDGTLFPRSKLVREFGSEETERGLEILQHVGLIAGEQNDTAFRYTGEMFRRWYHTYGILADKNGHDLELHTLLVKLDQDLADKYISAWGIYQADLPNYSGAVGEMRDILTLLLHQLAPDDKVRAESDFQFEAGEKKPTRRQRVRYIAKQRYKQPKVNEITSDFGLFETECDQLAQVVTGAYRTGSGLTHTTASRELAYRALKQFDSILVQLLY